MFVGGRMNEEEGEGRDGWICAYAVHTGLSSAAEDQSGGSHVKWEWRLRSTTCVGVQEKGT